MSESSAALLSRLGAVGMSVGIDVHFDGGLFDEHLLASVRKTAVQAVMVFAFGPDYLAIALAAQGHNMALGWYVLLQHVHVVINIFLLRMAWLKINSGCEISSLCFQGLDGNRHGFWSRDDFGCSNIAASVRVS
jgi:hypothetical protein